MAAKTWPVPAIAGTDFGETNDPTSIRRTPVADRASTSRTRPATGTGRSVWSPSRGPTSRMLTDAGSCNRHLGRTWLTRRSYPRPWAGGAEPGGGLHAVEEVALLARELLVGQQAALVQGGEPLEVVEGARRPAERPRVRRRDLLGQHPPAVLLHAAVDLELHALRVADVLEGRLAVLARRLDEQVAGADQPLEERLRERDVVDALERDLAGEPGHEAAAEDQPVGRQHEVGGRPAHDPREDPDREGGQARDLHGDAGAPLEAPARHEAPGEAGDDDDEDGQERGTDERPPVRAEVVDDLLVLTKQPVGERHASRPPRNRRPRDRRPDGTERSNGLVSSQGTSGNRSISCNRLQCGRAPRISGRAGAVRLPFGARSGPSRCRFAIMWA